MKCLFVSDLHAALRLPLARVDDGAVSSDRLRDVLDVLRQAGEYAEQNGIEAVFIAGDLFDQKHPDGATLVHTSRELATLALRCRTYVLPGNHDAIDRDGRMYSLQMYGELDVRGLHVLGHETIEVTPGLRVHAVPWLPDERALKRIRARSKEISKRKGDVDVLLFHQGIEGALWDSGRESDDGLDPDSVSELGWSHAVTGHYHRPQEFGDGGRYLGSPLDLRFGDEEVEQRGFWVCDFSTGAWELVPVKAPRFFTHRITVEQGGSFADHMPPDLPKDVGYLRVIVEGPAAVIDRERAMLHKVAEERMGGRLRALKFDLRPEREVRDRLEVDPSLSLAEMARRYAAKAGPELAPDLDVSALTEVGLRFLEDR